MDFQLEAPFAPSGDQPEAIEALVKGVKEGMDNAGPFGGNGYWQDFYHCPDDPKGTAAYLGHCSQ